MHTPHERDQLVPPEPPARLRAIALAVLVHAALIGALTWGVHWKDQDNQPAVEAELWSAVPQQAAPRAVEPPPPPAPPPQPAPAPAPPPPAPAARSPEPDPSHEADIAIEREKKKRLEQEKKERERKEAERKEKERLQKEKAEKEKAEREKAEKAEKAARQKAEREKEHREKLAEQKKAEQEKQKKLAENQRKADEAAQRKAEADARQLAAQREANLRRIQGLAGATGSETATGNALRNTGPSGSYGGKVAAKVKPNIVYPDAIAGNPTADVEVRLAPDGTIVSKRLLKSSGNKSWDEAVLRALEKTETLPRDVDGRAPPSITIGFSPRD